MNIEGFDVSGLGDLVQLVIKLPKAIMITSSKVLYNAFASIPQFVKLIMFIGFLIFVIMLAVWCWKNRYAWMEVRY